MAPSGAGTVLMLLLLMDTHAYCQEIIKSPMAPIVFLNDTGVFECETTGGEFTVWRINGTKIDGPIKDDLYMYDDGHGLFIMNFVARAAYNRTTVQCVTGDVGGVPVESENASLTIQGLLSSVVNLETGGNISSINLSWSAPFSLDVTGVDPDIWYSVLIYNVTDEENPTAVPCTDCHNLTQTHYFFSPDYPSPRQNYTFTVVPYNGAGQGESSLNITAHFSKETIIQSMPTTTETTKHSTNTTSLSSTSSSIKNGHIQSTSVPKKDNGYICNGCSNTAVIIVSAVSFLLIITFAIIIITQCLVMVKMKKSRDVVHRNTPAVNPTTMQSDVAVKANEAYELHRITDMKRKYMN